MDLANAHQDVIQTGNGLPLEVRLGLERQRALIDELLAGSNAASQTAVTMPVQIDTNVTSVNMQRKRTHEMSNMGSTNMMRAATSNPALETYATPPSMSRPRNISVNLPQRPQVAMDMMSRSFGVMPSYQYANSNPDTTLSPDEQYVMSPPAFLNSRRESMTSNGSKRFRPEASLYANPIAISGRPQYGRNSYPMLSQGDMSNLGYLSTSFGTQSSGNTAFSAPGMSRQSSIAGYSQIGDGFNMMRIQSDTATSVSQPGPGSSHGLLDCDLVSDFSAPPEVPTILRTVPTWSSGDSNTTQKAENVSLSLLSQDDDVLGQIGQNGELQTGADLSNVQGDENLLTFESVSMERTSSTSSNDSNGSTESARERKAKERLARHQQNSKQLLLSKAELEKGSIEGSAGPSNTAAKQAITKAPYKRPKQEKQYCHLCNEKPDGFHGIHELRRHSERKHASISSAWQCVQPDTVPDKSWPEKPLSSCKQCKAHKIYNAYYNAAAHIRRAHFHPRKRGRRPKGELRESRAGKAGGNIPTITWLKKNGWLREVKVTAAEREALQIAEDCMDDEQTIVSEEPNMLEFNDFPPNLPYMDDNSPYFSQPFGDALGAQRTPGVLGAGEQFHWDGQPFPAMEDFDEYRDFSL